MIKRLQKALLQELASNVQAIEDDPSAADLLGERHKMTQALGIPCRTEDPENPAIYLHVDVVPFNPGDVCIVGTDGMYDVLTDADITRVRRVAVEQNSNPARLAGTLLMCAAGLSLGRTTQRTQKRDDITTGVYAPHGINIKDQNTTDPGREPPYIQRMMDEIKRVYGPDFFTLDYNDMDARIAATNPSKM